MKIHRYICKQYKYDCYSNLIIERYYENKCKFLMQAISAKKRDSLIECSELHNPVPVRYVAWNFSIIYLLKWSGWTIL